MPTVTGKVYNHSKRMKEKRAVLDGVATELRRIIGQSVPAACCLISKLPQTMEARSDSDRAFSLKHRETRHLTTGTFMQRPR